MNYFMFGHGNMSRLSVDYLQIEKYSYSIFSN
jgi:hypothetical protein